MFTKMSKLTTFMLGGISGLIVGGFLIFFLLIGVPSANLPQGSPVQPLGTDGIPAGTASISLNQQFFDTVLAVIFRDMNAPAFELSRAENIAFQNSGCDGKVVLLPEGSGVKTRIQLENNKINAPLAFRGSYSILGYCYQFSGWAQAEMTLRYNEAKQTVEGQIDVKSVNLDSLPVMASGVIARYVQTTLNKKVNPIEILRTQQIALNVQVAATDGTLSAKVKEVRAEIKENTLNLYVIYNFSGSKKMQKSV